VERAVDEHAGAPWPAGTAVDPSAHGVAGDRELRAVHELVDQHGAGIAGELEAVDRAVVGRGDLGVDAVVELDAV
ncbi:hypothetical protein CN514_25220, partial [Bacillus sp. AFS001701]